MDQQERHVTLAIHTYKKALELKTLLETEGIEATLQNVNLEKPCVAPGVRVRIKESDLPLALRIVENPEVFSCDGDVKRQRYILVPVDFSPHSHHASLVAFNLAYHQNATLKFLHTYTDPYLSDTLQLSETLDYTIDDSFDHNNTQLLAEKKLNDFLRTLKDRIKEGELPPVAFESSVTEGIPEEEILKITKTDAPVMIVMGTRGADAKERDLVGSVTAEVLDSSRVPVVTLPCSDNQLSLMPRRILMFVNFDQEDFLALDALHRFMPSQPGLSINFVHLCGHNSSSFNASNYHALLNYAEKHYPECHFSVSSSTAEELLAELESSAETKAPELIVVPNRKRSIFARLFNPGMAHKLLFHADIPMMVLPV